MSLFNVVFKYPLFIISFFFFFKKKNIRIKNQREYLYIIIKIYLFFRRKMIRLSMGVGSSITKCDFELFDKN